VNYWREAIADALPPQYEATLGERVYLVEYDPEARKLGYPDIAVTHGEALSNQASSSAATATLEPVTIPLTMLDGPRESYVEILHLPERSLVTTLELLSPTNKQQPGRTAYLEKRRALLFQNVNLIELDVLVEGLRLPLMERPPVADYYYLLSRADQRPDCQVYHWTVRQPLPTLPVPLRHPDPDIQINLAEVFDTAYERGRFFRRIAYTESMPAFMSEADRAWAKGLMKQQ
jgi:hypothetical protein